MMTTWMLVWMMASWMLILDDGNADADEVMPGVMMMTKQTTVAGTN